MAKYAIWYICLLCVFASNCGPKIEPVSTTDDPDFFITGLVQNEPVSIKAGVEGNFMETEVKQGLVKSFTGKLINTTCASCNPSIEIIIRNYTIRNEPIAIDSAFAIGDYSFFDNNQLFDTTYILQVNDQSTGNGNLALLWDFGFGQTTSQPKSKVLFKKSGIYSVNQFSNYPSCTGKLTQDVHLTPTRVGKSTDFNFNYIDSHLLLFNSIPVSETASITWNFGDGGTASGSIVEHQFKLKGQYKVCMQWILNGDTAEMCKNINTSNNEQCAANFNFNSALQVDSFHFSKVTVNWISKDGKKYSSANINQPAESKFSILNRSSYVQNNKGEQTQLLDLVFSCVVSDGINTLQLKNMRGKFGVAYR